MAASVVSIGEAFVKYLKSMFIPDKGVDILIFDGGSDIPTLATEDLKSGSHPFLCLYIKPGDSCVLTLTIILNGHTKPLS